MSIPSLRVTADLPDGRIERQFSAGFRIGRLDECDIAIKDSFVSRYHIEVFPEAGQWHYRDLGSANGIFLDSQRADSGLIGNGTRLRLGVGGPFLTFETVAAKPPKDLDAYLNRYFEDGQGGEPAGEHTVMIRKAFSQVKKKQQRKYGWIFVALAVVIVAIGSYSFWIHQQTKDQLGLARTLFYSLKAVELDIAGLEKLLDNNPESRERIRQLQSRREAMRDDYEKFLAAIRKSDAQMSPRQRQIVRVARIFGECELDLPPDFVREVETYIEKWRSSNRLSIAIRTAVDKGYVPVITRELLAQQLPPQFFYLALQESNFDPFISGPPTRFGFAKGMWQFIPQTGAQYGLKIGPLVDFARPDTADDRHNWEKSTRAAAHYLKDLYATDAQASGFLVMVCYNWGEGQVLPLVRGMPNNPRERNFWRLLAGHRARIPQESYDYVFYILSAAAIGEDPRLFGFSFDNPLANMKP